MWAAFLQPSSNPDWCNNQSAEWKMNETLQGDISALWPGPDLPMFTSSSVSASPIHSNWNSCSDWENFWTAAERSGQWEGMARQKNCPRWWAVCTCTKKSGHDAIRYKDKGSWILHTHKNCHAAVNLGASSHANGVPVLVWSCFPSCKLGNIDNGPGPDD